MLHGHGDNGYLFNIDIKANFSSNVYYKGPSAELLLHLQNRLGLIGRYPEVAGESFARQLAQFHHSSEANVLVTNGATEAFYLLAQHFAGSKSSILCPSFAEYTDACRTHGHSIEPVTHAQLASKTFSPGELIWLCNPNNPDGKIIEPELIITLCRYNSHSMFIVDEAYADFLLRDVSVLPFVSQLENLIIVKSLTKKYALPGLRLGYLLAPGSIIEALKAIKQPWSVNSLALEAGKFIFDSTQAVFNPEEWLIHSEELQKELGKIEALTVHPSSTPYFLVSLPKPSAETFNYLLYEHGLLVRDASNFFPFPNPIIRVCAQQKHENYLLINALAQWTKC